jgi:protein-tyrosine phosphatase
MTFHNHEYYDPSSAQLLADANLLLAERYCAIMRVRNKSTFCHLWGSFTLKHTFVSPIDLMSEENNSVINLSQLEKRVIHIDGTINFRDLGGYLSHDGRTIKWRQMFRSAQLNQLSEQGVKSLAALNMKTVIDLRFDEETSRYPTIRNAVPDATFFSWRDEITSARESAKPDSKSSKMRRSWRDSLDSNDPAIVREAMRSNYPNKLYSHRGIYRRMLLRLIDGHGPLLFHCAAGKDRTGVAAALILSLLGVDDQQIIEDYLLTQSLIEGRMENLLAAGANVEDDFDDFQSKLAAQPKEMLKPIFDADRNYITTLLDYVAQTYEGFNRYAHEQLELTDADILQLQNQLLE